MACFRYYEGMNTCIETRVGIVGDWHGDHRAAVAALKGLKTEGITVVYHVGDFGFWPGRDGVKFLRGLERQLDMYGQTIYVTMGNHDDYPQVDALPVSEDGLRWATEHIAVMPRGYRWNVSGRSFVSLGGAPSINFPDLKEGISWWREEAITMGDVYRIAEGGQAEIMITHDAPNGITPLEQMMSETRREWSPEGLQYADQGRALMTQAVLSVKPKMLFHGHYHKDYIEETTFEDYDGTFDTTVVGLNRNLYANNAIILNVATLETEWVPGTGY